MHNRVGTAQPMIADEVDHLLCIILPAKTICKSCFYGLNLLDERLMKYTSTGNEMIFGLKFNHEITAKGDCRFVMGY